eukprot:TRINITY_DN5424_c0_g1_i2.p1 TRINITY_DN5424_c0_g1~~TRINITY_DN5424_c0_g1_i2.p1  ORF type:complete len:798 (+),score=179.72 TRINITY_DN5424_c0_g1_i2:132-2525(+)
MADNGSNQYGLIGTAQVHHKYLHTNMTSHTWLFGAVAELIDNARDPDVAASTLNIDVLNVQTDNPMLRFTDDGNGLSYRNLQRMLSLGFCDKKQVGDHTPIGEYGNGFKSGSMRLGTDAIIFSRCGDVYNIGMISQTFMKEENIENYIIPVLSISAKDGKSLLEPTVHHQSAKAIKKYSPFKTDDTLFANLQPLKTNGTSIFIWNLSKEVDGDGMERPEMDFNSDPFDIRLYDDSPSDAAVTGGSSSSSLKNVVDAPCRYSLREYCKILYLNPRMQIVLRGKKVRTFLIKQTLSFVEVMDSYKPPQRIGGADAEVKLTFGMNRRNMNLHGIMWYHRGRLIRFYERIGIQLQKGQKAWGVLGIVEADCLTASHNKQFFVEDRRFAGVKRAAGDRLETYSLIQRDPDVAEAGPLSTWVQCSRTDCLKWRRLPPNADTDIHDDWYCSQNVDVTRNRCEIPQEEDKGDTTPAHALKLRQREAKKRKLEMKVLQKFTKDAEAKKKASAEDMRRHAELERQQEETRRQQLEAQRQQEEARRLEEQARQAQALAAQQQQEAQRQAQALSVQRQQVEEQRRKQEAQDRQVREEFERLQVERAAQEQRQREHDHAVQMAEMQRRQQEQERQAELDRKEREVQARNQYLEQEQEQRQRVLDDLRRDMARMQAEEAQVQEELKSETKLRVQLEIRQQEKDREEEERRATEANEKQAKEQQEREKREREQEKQQIEAEENSRKRRRVEGGDGATSATVALSRDQVSSIITAKLKDHLSSSTFQSYLPALQRAVTDAADEILKQVTSSRE